MSEVLVVALSLALNALLPYFIVKFDLARLSELQLSRAWTEASFLSAVIGFGPLSLPVHFVKTRRSLWGLILGLASCVLALAAQSVLVYGVSALCEALSP